MIGKEGLPDCISENRRYSTGMSTERFVYWEDGDHLLGFFEGFPDYWTQGESLDDLKVQLADLYKDLTSGEIPGIRRVAELQIT